jgi:hypothetical protein
MSHTEIEFKQNHGQDFAVQSLTYFMDAYLYVCLVALVCVLALAICLHICMYVWLR